jgi:hypothetical protein
VGIIFIFTICILSVSAIGGLLPAPLALVVLVIDVWLIARAFQGRLSFIQQDVGQINNERHGRKCHMEGLSYGEREVATTLSYGLSYKDYFIFNNLIIPSKSNESTQIDHIVVSKFGIFVIESKDYGGWIFGHRNQPFWTQVFRGGKKFHFQNPIHQNYEHIMSLRNLIPLPIGNFYSIIVFSNKSEIKTAPIENVMHLKDLIGYISNCAQEKLGTSDVQMAIGKLSYACQTIDTTTSEHVANLRAHKSV